MQRLEWDSELFGYDVGKVELASINQKVIKSVLLEARTYKLVYVFTDEIINHQKFKLVDVKISLTRINDKFDETGFQLRSICNIQCYDSGIHDKFRIERLALLSGVYSRFYVDKKFVKGEYEKLYKVWIKKSLEKVIADCTLLAMVDEEIAGFVTLKAGKENSGEIGLIAVAPEFRSMGIAKCLMMEAIKEAEKTKMSRVDVVTQERNIPAMRLYMSLGFKPISKEYIYHIWNEHTI